LFAPEQGPPGAEVMATLKFQLPLVMTKAELAGAIWVASREAEGHYLAPAEAGAAILAGLCARLFDGLTPGELVAGWEALGVEIGMPLPPRGGR